MRPRQWVKNAFVLPALIFSRHLFEFPYLWRSVGAVACFVLLSGVVYIFNDIIDRGQDRLHPDSEAEEELTHSSRDWGRKQPHLLTHFLTQTSRFAVVAV